MKFPRRMVVNENWAKVRYFPEWGARIVRELEPGTEVVVIALKNDYWKLDGGGYIHMNALRDA